LFGHTHGRTHLTDCCVWTTNLVYWCGAVGRRQRVVLCKLQATSAWNDQTTHTGFTSRHSYHSPQAIQTGLTLIYTTATTAQSNLERVTSQRPH